MIPIRARRCVTSARRSGRSPQATPRKPCTGAANRPDDAARSGGQSNGSRAYGLVAARVARSAVMSGRPLAVSQVRVRLDLADIGHPIRMLIEAFRTPHAAPSVIRRRSISSVRLPGRLLRAFDREIGFTIVREVQFVSLIGPSGCPSDGEARRRRATGGRFAGCDGLILIAMTACR